jgi:PASTA domain
MLKKAVLAAVAVASIAGVASAAPAKPKPCHVPNVVGKTLEQARQSLRARDCGWRANRTSGRVHAQQVRPGRTLPHGAKVGLFLVPIVKPVPPPTTPTPTPTPTPVPTPAPPPLATSTLITTAQALSGQLQGGYPIMIDAEVHDANGAAIPNTSITWTVSAAGQQLLSFTDPDFTTLTEVVNVPAGTALTVQASYPGDPTHAPSSNQATITIPIPICTDQDGDGDQNAGGVDDGDGCI